MPIPSTRFRRRSPIATQAAASLCARAWRLHRRRSAGAGERIRRGRAFVYVRRQVTPDQARRVADLQLEGVGFMKENRRFYPNKELAAHVLGYVGLDNAGLAGVEATYDNLIKGHAGTVLIQTDAKRHAFSRIERPSTTGADSRADDRRVPPAHRRARAAAPASSGRAPQAAPRS